VEVECRGGACVFVLEDDVEGLAVWRDGQVGNADDLILALVGEFHRARVEEFGGDQGVAGVILHGIELAVEFGVEFLAERSFATESLCRALICDQRSIVGTVDLEGVPGAGNQVGVRRSLFDSVGKRFDGDGLGFSRVFNLLSQS